MNFVLPKIALLLVSIAGICLVAGVLSKRMVRIVASILGTSILVIFVVGLAKSITDGFAGFYGGLPFWIIALLVLAMAVYDMWDEGIKKRK